LNDYRGIGDPASSLLVILELIASIGLLIHAAISTDHTATGMLLIEGAGAGSAPVTVQAQQEARKREAGNDGDVIADV